MRIPPPELPRPVPYDSRYICGKWCNYAVYNQPAITYFGVATPPTGQPLLATNANNVSVYNGYDLGTNLHWALSDAFSIDNILAYQHFETTWASDDDLSPSSLNLGQNKQTHWNWSEELRLNAKISDSMSAVLGALLFQAANRLLVLPGHPLPDTAIPALPIAVRAA